MRSYRGSGFILAKAVLFGMIIFVVLFKGYLKTFLDAKQYRSQVVRPPPPTPRHKAIPAIKSIPRDAIPKMAPKKVSQALATTPEKKKEKSGRKTKPKDSDSPALMKKKMALYRKEKNAYDKKVARLHDGRHHVDKPILLSKKGSKASSDVRGNLGDIDVILSNKMDDWLKDRWQTAKNMQGEPIPGEHWVRIQLATRGVPTAIILDWETAHAVNYALHGRDGDGGDPIVLFDASVNPDPVRGVRTVSKSKQHVLHEIRLFPENLVDARHQPVIDRVELTIRWPQATAWGASLWRFEVWGKAPPSKSVKS